MKKLVLFDIDGTLVLTGRAGVRALDRALVAVIAHKNALDGISIAGRTDRAIIIGKGKNLQFMEQLNARHGFFGELHVVEHPRSIMQYRRRQLERYLAEYDAVFRRAGGVSGARHELRKRG